MEELTKEQMIEEKTALLAELEAKVYKKDGSPRKDASLDDIAAVEQVKAELAKLADGDTDAGTGDDETSTEPTEEITAEQEEPADGESTLEARLDQLEKDLKAVVACLNKKGIRINHNVFVPKVAKRYD